MPPWGSCSWAQNHQTWNHRHSSNSTHPCEGAPGFPPEAVPVWYVQAQLWQSNSSPRMALLTLFRTSQSISIAVLTATAVVDHFWSISNTKLETSHLQYALFSGEVTPWSCDCMSEVVSFGRNNSRKDRNGTVILWAEQLSKTRSICLRCCCSQVPLSTAQKALLWLTLFHSQSTPPADVGEP